MRRLCTQDGRLALVRFSTHVGGGFAAHSCDQERVEGLSTALSSSCSSWGSKLKESKELECRGVAEAAPEALKVLWTTKGRWPPVVALCEALCVRSKRSRVIIYTFRERLNDATNRGCTVVLQSRYCRSSLAGLISKGASPQGQQCHSRVGDP